jgi:hypothetical protein
MSGSFLERSARPPSCESPLKIPHHLIQEFAIRHLMAKYAVRRTPLQLRLWFYIVQGLKKYATKKFIINGQWRNKLFFIVINRFSLVKVAMNVLRVSKLRKNCLTVIDHRTMVLKTPQFLNFSFNIF